MAQQRVTIRYPDGTNEQHYYRESETLVAEIEGDWVRLSIIRHGSEPDLRVFCAVLYRANVTSELVDDEPDHAD